MRVNVKSISHRCHLFDVAFVWELTKETIHLPLGCFQGGSGCDSVKSLRSSYMGPYPQNFCVPEQGQNLALTVLFVPKSLDSGTPDLQPHHTLG